jgi:acyl carrier protein
MIWQPLRHGPTPLVRCLLLIEKGENDIMKLEEALIWIADLFEESPENVKPGTKREDIPGWDSLGVLTLMAGLDEEFDILLTEEEMQELRKIKDILKILKKHGQMNE